MSADDRDDDLDGDDQLRSLRTVWVSMRESDEDPPDRGLAALMAAAREKAGEMAAPPKPSFWQRALAAFRRPPVLALASVTVLLGGALFIANRREEMKAESTIAVPRGQAAGPPSAAAPAAGSAAVATPPPPIPEPSFEAETKPIEQHEAAPPADRSPPRRRPGRATPKPPPPEAAAEERPDGAKPGADSGLVAGERFKDRDDAPAAEPDAPKVDKTPATRAPVARGEAQLNDESATIDDTHVSRIQRLVKQCEVAAARGDCAVVRRLAGQIKSEDAGVYAQRVQKSSAIVRCLDAGAAISR